MSGLKPTLGTAPLNQNGLPAASSEPETVAPLASSAAGLPPLAGRSTLWNPVGTNLTESPAWIVIALGKNAFTSDWYLPSAFCAAIGVPMSTLFVAARAVGASTSDSAAAQAKTVSLLTFCSFRLDSAD